MTSRIVAAGCALMLAASQAAATAPSPSAPPPDKAPAAPAERLFQLSLRYNYQSVPKQVQRFDFWFPFPFDDAFQTRHNTFTLAPYDMEPQTDPVTGNVWYHMVGGPRGGVPM